MLVIDDTVRYFHGELSDGKKFVRVISLDPSLQNAFKRARDKESTVALSNCQVKPNRDNPEELELVLTNHSKVNTSPRKFIVDKRLKLPIPTKTVNLSEMM